MPILSFDSLDMVPEELREHAKADETSGKVQINVVPAVKLNEFRDRNISITKELDEAKGNVGKLSQIVGDKPDEFVQELDRLRKVHKRVQDKELVDSTSLEEAVSQRTTEMRTGYEDQIKAKSNEVNAWKQKAEELDTRFKKSLIDRAITDAVLDAKSGARPEALADILQRAYGTFRVTDDGKIIPHQGDAILYGSDGSSPMTPGEWLKKLGEQAPYFFKSSTGGGGGSTIPGSGGKMTSEQIAKLTPDEYRKLRREGKI